MLGFGSISQWAISFFGSDATPPTSTVTGVTVSPAAATVVNGSSQQYTANVQGTNSPSQAVTWAISGAGSISSTGLATGAAGTYTVTATSVQDPTKSGTETFTVLPAGAASPSPKLSVVTIMRKSTVNLVAPLTNQINTIAKLL